MSNKMRASKFETLISSPWGKPPENSYYGDPRNVKNEEEVEKVVILGYN